MAAITDLTPGQTVLLEATVKSINALDNHFQEVTLELTDPDLTAIGTHPEFSFMFKKQIKASPAQITIPT
jgi:hypothetical protein